MQKFSSRLCCTPDNNDYFGEMPTPMLDVVEYPIHLKNLSIKVDLEASFCAMFQPGSKFTSNL